MRENGRILAIDDEDAMLAIYRDILEPLGWQLETVKTYAGALARLSEGNWNVILLDLRLQGIHGPEDGLRLLPEVARRNPGARTIMVTGHAGPESIALAYAAGLYGLLEKTQDFAPRLRTMVEEAMSLIDAQRTIEIAADK